MKRARQIPRAKPAPWKRERLATSVTRWKPIALTWRKASRATRSGFASAGGAVARYNWSPRFNLNIHLAFTIHALPSRTGTRSATASPIPGRQSHAQFTSLHMLARSSLTTETRRLVSHRLRDVVTHTRTKRAPSHAEIDKLFRAYTLPTPARSIRATTASSVGPGRIHTSAAMETTSLTQLSRSTYWSRHRTMRLAWRTQAELVFEPSMPSTAGRCVRLPELGVADRVQSKMLDAIERSISVTTSAVAPPGAVRTPQFEQSPAPFGFSPARHARSSADRSRRR